MSTQRIRMIAGPNGSGKSAILDLLRAREIPLGMYLNADDLERDLKNCGRHVFFDCPDLANWNTPWLRWLSNAPRPNVSADTIDYLRSVTWSNNAVSGVGVPPDSYGPSMIVEFGREQCLFGCHSCTFETVMSHPTKVEFLELAKTMGGRVYLYFVATEDPEINISRVAHRAANGGHNVRPDKIVQRYHRSIGLLGAAIAASHRAYLFDNSTHQPSFVAEACNGVIEARTTPTPFWTDALQFSDSSPDDEAD
jgi:predicted ABC-type ATPase